MNRITEHPVLDVKEKKTVKFYFGKKELEALEGEAVSSALFANGLRIFSYHQKDGAPQGIFCANGQCAQCSVVADGKVVKACVTALKAGMKIEPLRGAVKLDLSEKAGEKADFERIEELETDALIIGAGPSGLACAAELGKFNLDVLLIDDKDKAGGKLVLQTHKFFGSVEDCYAGARGIDIADKLSEGLKEYPSVKLWTGAVCAAVFSDKKAGVVKNGVYYLIKPKAFVVAAGAREKSLLFPGNTLPGVYGAGAFQTLVNRDLIKAAKRLFIVGGGNVGLIAAYHALQAGIEVVGLAEAAPRCGGYKVHEDKLRRLGVPVYTGHTILEARGKEELESVTICEVDEKFAPVKGAEKNFRVDTLLIAVGLNPVDEFHLQASEYGMNSFVCGDAQEIAEASAAMFSGKITAHKVLKNLGFITGDVPRFWFDKLEILKSRPGKTRETDGTASTLGNRIYPVLHCAQEIPCNPCVTVCPKKSIKLSGDSIMSLPEFSGDCIGCFKCLIICPGLAVTLVDARKDPENPLVWLAYENDRKKVKKGDKAVITGEDAKDLCETKIEDIRDMKAENTLLVCVRLKKELAAKAASVRISERENFESWDGAPGNEDDRTLVCRCERVTLGEIRKHIRNGVRDLNQLKALTRAGMGACGAKTCNSLILGIMKNEGVKPEELTDFTKRPLFLETELGIFAGAGDKKEEKDAPSFSGF